jgi:hypothetical protein
VHYRSLFNNRPSVSWPEVLKNNLKNSPSGELALPAKSLLELEVVMWIVHVCVLSVLTSLALPQFEAIGHQLQAVGHVALPP